MSARLLRLIDRRLRPSAFGTAAAGLVATIALAYVARAGLDLSPLYPVRTTIVFAVVMIVALGLLDQHHPFSAFGPANQVTTARAALTALVAGLVFEAAIPTRAVSAVAAGLVVTALDGFDGWLARRSRMASRFGARFDMEVDALLIMILAALTWRYGKAGPWVMLSGLLRYLFVAAGWLFSWLRQPLPASRRRQTVCVIQVVALLAAILPAVAPSSSALIAGAALTALVSSFLIDTRWLWKHAPPNSDGIRPTKAGAPAFPFSS